MKERPVVAVRNASDPNQVKGAERREERLEDERREFYRAVLDTVEGRAVFWDLITKADIYKTIFHPSGSQLYYNAGRRDYGLELMAEIVGIDEGLYLLMEKEARHRLKQQARETAAAHTPKAGEVATEERNDG